CCDDSHPAKARRVAATSGRTRKNNCSRTAGVNDALAAEVIQVDVSLACYAGVEVVASIRPSPRANRRRDQTKQSRLGRWWLQAIDSKFEKFNIEGRGDMFRLAATAALACAGFWADNGHAAGTRGSGVPPGSSALITNCYKTAERIVPRARGRSAWVVRHADHCVRSGGSP